MSPRIFFRLTTWAVTSIHSSWALSLQSMMLVCLSRLAPTSHPCYRPLSHPDSYTNDDPGCFFGAIIAVGLGEKLGRRKSVLVGTTIMSIGAILQICSYSVAQMIVGRIICGFGLAIVSTSVPLYQRLVQFDCTQTFLLILKYSEIAPAKQRGKYVVMNHIGMVAGLAVAFWYLHHLPLMPDLF